MVKTTKKLPLIITALAALIIGAALGALGYSLLERSRPKPLFSFDPKEIKQIHIQAPDGYDDKGDIVMILDRERIDYIVGLLNGFPQKSEEKSTQPESCSIKLYLYNTNNDVTRMFFDTYTDGTPDVISINNSTGGSVRYTTDSGYFKELPEMTSTDPDYFGLEPTNPGPTAQPKSK